MFWIALLGLSLSWMLAKLGFLSATVGIMSLMIKALLIVMLFGATAGMILWLRKKSSGTTDKQ